MTTISVLTGPERRRRWSPAEKARIVEESVAPGTVVAEVAHRHDVHANLLHHWRRRSTVRRMPMKTNAATGQWNQILCRPVKTLIRIRKPEIVRVAAMGRGR